jgi:hypothetical protein
MARLYWYFIDRPGLGRMLLAVHHRIAPRTLYIDADKFFPCTVAMSGGGSLSADAVVVAGAQ